MKKQVALYARVSTTAQVEEATIESQVAELERYARNQEYAWQPEHIFLEQGVSGAHLDRPALNRMRDQAAGGEFSAVLCLSPDRLARNYAYQWVLVDELKRVGVEIIFVQAPIHADDPQGALLLGIQGLFAEYERTMITERLRRGKLYRMREGSLVSPNPPYGYRYVPVSQVDGGRWEADEAQAEVVRQLYNWYLAPDQPAVTELVQRLNEQGSPAPRGALWRYKSVHAILTQSAYVGWAYFNTTRNDPSVIGQAKRQGRGVRMRPGHLPREQAEWVKIPVPALLEESIWEQVQDQLKVKQRFSPRNSQKGFYLLRSLLVCDVCGRTLAGHSSSTGSVVYRCNNGGRQREAGIPPHSRVISSQIADDLVWAAVAALLDNPLRIADAWQAGPDPSASAPDESARLRRRQNALHTQWARLLDAYADGLLTKEELTLRKQTLDAEEQLLYERIHALEQRIQQAQVTHTLIADFETFCQETKAKLAQATPELRQELIRLLVDHVVVAEQEIVIHHVLPLDDDFRLLPRHR